MNGFTRRHDGPFHGGDLDGAEARFGRPPAGWLDLSTGINRRPYRLDGVPVDAWTQLPQPGAVAAACAAAATCYGASAPVLAAPGTQALIQWLGRLRRPGRVAVIAPTYAEHGAAWQAAGHQVSQVSRLEDAVAGADVVVAVNPNNPDGRRHPPAPLLAAAAELAGRGGLLVVDEAFADVDPAISLAPAAGRPGLVVLRSFGKFFGLPGARLGFALGPAELLEGLRRGLGPWAVAGPALALAARALTDDGWIAHTRRRLGADAARLDGLLAGAGLEVVGGTDLFRLSAAPPSADLHAFLGRRGILVRQFPERAEWLRWGLPGDEAEFGRLGDALAAWAADGT